MSLCYDYFIKILLIGNKGVGKTTFIYKFLNKKDEKVVPTIGLDYHHKFIETTHGIIKIRIWDTSGNCTYDTVLDRYSRACHGFIFFYDISNNESLLDIEKWINKIELCIEGKLYEKNIDYILIGTKSDLHDNINIKDLLRIKEKYNCDSFTYNHLSDTSEKHIYHLINKILNNQYTKNQLFKSIDKRDTNEKNIVLFEVNDYEIILNKNSGCCC